MVSGLEGLHCIHTYLSDDVIGKVSKDLHHIMSWALSIKHSLQVQPLAKPPQVLNYTNINTPDNIETTACFKVYTYACTRTWDYIASQVTTEMREATYLKSLCSVLLTETDLSALDVVEILVWFHSTSPGIMMLGREVG